MAGPEKKPGGADGKKKKFYRQFAKGVTLGRSTYTSKVQGLEAINSMLGHQATPQSLASR
jgi:hypothetical protein